MPYPNVTIAWRGQLARLRADAQQHKPEDGEHEGRLRCICGCAFHFTIQADGRSHGHCTAGCGARWDQ